MIEREARQDMATYSQIIHREGFVAATDGNLSVRLDDRRILITPSGIRKEDMTPEAPVIVDYDGNVLSGQGSASSEKKIHLKAYLERPDVHAVIHAHPVYSIALTVAGMMIDTCLLPETVVTLGAVPVAPYATPSTEELPDSIEPYVKESDVVMLSRHGSLTMGKDLGTATKLLEKLEQAAQITYLALTLGGVERFSTAELERLQGLRGFYGVSTQQLACSVNQPGPGGVESAQTAAPAGAASSAEPCGCDTPDSTNLDMTEEQVAKLVDLIAGQVTEKIRQG
jgi:L-fuculose-phosphate aldolase